MSLEDIYNDVSKSMEDQKPALIELLENHIDFETIIPARFYNAFSNGMAEAIPLYAMVVKYPINAKIHKCAG